MVLLPVVHYPQTILTLKYDMSGFSGNCSGNKCWFVKDKRNGGKFAFQTEYFQSTLSRTIV